MKREIFTEKNEALNVTRLELNKLKGRVKEMDVNSLVKELTRQKYTEVDLRRQLNELRKQVEDVKVNSTLAVNELKQLANRSTQVTVSDIFKFYYMTQITGSVGAGTRRIKSCTVIVYLSEQDTFILPARDYPVIHVQCKLFLWEKRVHAFETPDLHCFLIYHHQGIDGN